MSLFPGKNKVRLSPFFYPESVVLKAVSGFKGCSFKDGILDFGAEGGADEFLNYLLALAKSAYEAGAVSEVRNESGMPVFNFRGARVGSKFLLSSDSGCWDFFSAEEVSGILSGSRVPERALEKGFVLNAGNSLEEVARLRKRYSFLCSVPSLHIVVLTARCNEKCAYCQASALPLGAEGADMSSETADFVVKRILEAGQGVVEFQGGEPLLCFGMIKYFVSRLKGVKFSVSTNLLLMNEEIASFFAEHGFGVCTSLDDSKSCRRSRDKTIFWIKRLKALFEGTGATVSALATITESSLPLWRELVDDYVSLGLDMVHLRPVKKIGFASKGVSADDFIVFWKCALDYIISLNEKGVRIVEREALVMLRRVLCNDSSYADLRSPCGAVIGQVVYNFDGRIYSCDEGRMVNGDLFCIGSVKESLKKAVFSEESRAILSSSINESHWCCNCVFKPFCGVCPVLNYAEFGSVVGRMSESSWCKIKKAQFAYLFAKLQEKGAGGVLRGWVAEGLRKI